MFCTQRDAKQKNQLMDYKGQVDSVEKTESAENLLSHLNPTPASRYNLCRWY